MNHGDLDEFIALERQTLMSNGFTNGFRRSSVLCESCGEGGRRPAAVYCENCCGNFCADCDMRFHPRSNSVMSRHTRTPADLPRSTHIRCRVHPEEPVMYTCLDCMTLSCAECVVHGVHRDHNVQDKRKSYYLIKEKTEQVLNQFHAQSEELAGLLRKVDLLKKEIIENTRSVKQTMATSFNEVRDRLNMKEEELMANADAFVNEQVGHLDIYVTSTHDKVGMLATVAGLVREQLETQDTVGLIHFYTENHNQFHALTSTISSLTHDLPHLATHKCYLDVNAANAQISALQGLHLMIAGLSCDPPQSSPTCISPSPMSPSKRTFKTQPKTPAQIMTSSTPKMATPNRPSSAKPSRAFNSPARK